MIRHIVFFSAKNESDLAEIMDGLRLLQQIPQARKLEISQNTRADTLSGEVDVVVYGEFADQAALDAYKAHALYQKSIERVRPLRQMRIAADIKASSS